MYLMPHRSFTRFGHSKIRWQQTTVILRKNFMTNPSIQKSDVASPAERDTLRRLGEETARIGSLPVQQEKADLWRRLNDREPVRPLVYINEEPWEELKPHRDELVCRCEDPFLREVEWPLRVQLYRWNNYPVDMVVRPVIEFSKVWKSTGIGIEQQIETISHGDINSYHFIPQINGEEDIEKICMPEVFADEEETARRGALLKELVGDILPVVPSGIKMQWFTPWDELIRLVPMEGIMMDLIDRPEFVDALVDRFVTAKMHEMDQLEKLGLLSAGANNCRIGSGAYGYTRELPVGDDSGAGLPCSQTWGCGNAQIFSEVSPQMHWEFSLKHEKRWLERWGLSYYGCCEPLHLKIGILREIRNLRKISASPWFDIPKGLENGAGDYVLSIKPNPAIFAEDGFDETRARRDIVRLFDQAQGCSVELVMKDISTVRGDPQRLQQWCAIAMEEAEKRG